jgi:hypothetical protein
LRGGEDAILQNEADRVEWVVGGKAARGGRWKKFLTHPAFFILQVQFFKRLIQWGKSGVLWYFRHGDLRFAPRNLGAEFGAKNGRRGWWLEGCECGRLGWGGIFEVGGLDRWRSMVFQVQGNAMR